MQINISHKESWVILVVRIISEIMRYNTLWKPFLITPSQIHTHTYTFTYCIFTSQYNFSRTSICHVEIVTHTLSRLHFRIHHPETWYMLLILKKKSYGELWWVSSWERANNGLQTDLLWWENTRRYNLCLFSTITSTKHHITSDVVWAVTFSVTWCDNIQKWLPIRCHATSWWDVHQCTFWACFYLVTCLLDDQLGKWMVLHIRSPFTRKHALKPLAEVVWGAFWP